jgi:Big-like domain-containing protein/VCBS repeat protein/FG-GAP repeat protein
MTQPFARKLLSFVSILVIVVMPPVALAQVGKTSPASAEPSMRYVPPGATTLDKSLERPLLAGAGSAQRSSVTHSLARQASTTPDLDTALFLPTVSYASGGSAPPAVAVADLNGDGKQDIAVVNPYGEMNGDGSVAVLLGNGDGTFQPAVVYDSGTVGSDSVAIADLRGNGKLDIVVGSEGCPAAASDCVSVLLGNGDGTFEPSVVYVAGGGLTYASSIYNSIPMVVADVNGDGKLDIVIEGQTDANYGDGVLGVLLGKGDGAFEPVVAYDSGGFDSSSFAVADVNGDGKADLVAVSCGPSGSSGCPNNNDAVVAVLLGKGDGTFRKAEIYATGGTGFFSSSVVVEDVNGDGKPDILVGNYCATGNGNCIGDGSVGVLLGNGNGTFRDAVSYDTGGIGTYSIVLADLDGNGKPDLIVNNGGTGVLLGNGDGTFQPVRNYFSTGGSVVVTDVNSDGKLDIVEIGNPASVLLGNGDGTFEGALFIYGSDSYFLAGTMADVNGDGRPDLISTSLSCGSCSSGSVGVQLNNPGFVYHSTTTTLISNKYHPNLYGLVTYTATVTSQSGGQATGNVYFFNGNAFFFEATLVNNQATATIRYDTLGTYTVSAIYSGDGSNGSSSSGTLTEYVQAPSTTVLTTSGSPVLVGQPVTFTATVTVAPKNGAIPNGGVVEFYDGPKEIGTGATASGVATFTTSSLEAGTHYIKAIYGGTATLKPSTGKLEQVVSKYATTTALVSSLNPSASEQKVTFTAAVTSSGSNVPTGYVFFKDGTTTIGATKLIGGEAAITKSNLAVGSHPITAEYEGDAVSAESISVVLTQVVN